jgi:hypothetical protein
MHVSAQAGRLPHAVRYRGGTNGTVKSFDTVSSLDLRLLTNGAQVIFTFYYQNI